MNERHARHGENQPTSRHMRYLAVNHDTVNHDTSLPLDLLRVCEGCNTLRPPREYEGLGEVFRYCSVCRSRGGSREILVSVKRAKGARA